MPVEQAVRKLAELVLVLINKVPAQKTGSGLMAVHVG